MHIPPKTVKIFKLSCSENECILCVTAICRHLVHGQQEDAHEFMRYLLESMEKAFLTRYKGSKYA